MSIKEFHLPLELNDALALLKDYGENALMIAGGTDAIIALRNRRLDPEHIIAINKIEDLNKITQSGNCLRIGALTTFAQIEESKLIKEQARSLHQAAFAVGSQQIRNLGTIGGNIANASVAGDTIAPLLCMEALIELHNSEGTRVIELSEFLKETDRTQRRPDELITHILIPENERMLTTYQKLGTRKALSIVVIGAAMAVTVDSKGRCLKCRMYGGALALRPLRFKPAEEYLAGKVLTRSLLEDVMPVLSDAVYESIKHRPWEVYYKMESVKGIYAQAFDDIMIQINERIAKVENDEKN